jgi:drug/metabolite transporter (DMT)-like permease
VSSLGLYVTSVLIWGSTWLAITFQFGPVPPAVSVVYRFLLAGAILFAWAAARRIPMRFTAAQHRWMALQGFLLFGLNYLLVYLAETRVASGLVAVAFSLMVVLNIVGSRLAFGTPVRRAVALGAALGIAGIVLVFLPEIRGGEAGGDAVHGLVFAVTAAFAASLGNLVAYRNRARGLPVIPMNAFGMIYGGLFVGAYALLTRQAFVFDPTPRYILSLLYLAVFGSILAFGAFLVLLGRIGADRAGYVTVAIPVVAVLLSGLFEGLRWHPSLLVGILLCVAGNVAVLRSKAAPAASAPPSPATAAKQGRTA